MKTIRPIERGDLGAIVKEPYSVTILEPGDAIDRLETLFELTGFWQQDAGAIAIDDGGLKGTVQFFRSGPCIHGYELGYVIHDKRDWGKGYASFGLQQLADRLFSERPGIHRLQLTIACDNGRSVRVAEKCGFEREGVLRASGFDSPPNDSFVYSKLR